MDPLSSFNDCRIVLSKNLNSSIGIDMISLSFAVFVYGILFFFTTLIFTWTTTTAATAIEKTKKQYLKELGLRPRGKNLWQWCFNYNLKLGDITGIPGYDPILGSFDPSTRATFHVAAMMCTWGIMLRIVGGFISSSSGGGGTNFCNGFVQDILPSGIVAMLLYVFVVSFIIHCCFSPVSKPGGPRPHKIRRVPYWTENHCTVLNKDDLNGWAYLTAEESHQQTLKQFNQTDDDGTATLLTGEPAGRQTWFKLEQQENDRQDIISVQPEKEQQAESKRSSGVGAFFASLVSSTKIVGNDDDKKDKNDSDGSAAFDESVVQEMALGGREKPGFDPSLNPNTNDQIYRAQQIRKYLSNYYNQSGDKKTDTKDDESTPASMPPPPDMNSVPKTVEESCRKGVQFYNMLQCDDGHWAGDYGGPHFLLPGLVIAWYVMNRPAKLLDVHQIKMIRHYIEVHQQVDGGWGTHIESPSTMFGTVLMYVVLRLVGASASDDRCVKAREFMNEHGGGALYTSSWSKFYLCLLGVMDWKGHNSVPPEMWLLPNWFPFHPGRMWCHARMVYLPMGYLYGNRFVYEKAESDPIIKELRSELYHFDGPKYDDIPWSDTRHYIAETDNYSPIPFIMKTLQNVLALYENWTCFNIFRNYVRDLGLKFSVDYMKAEDLQTNFIDIGPVNKVLNMLSMYHYHHHLEENKEEGKEQPSLSPSQLIVEKHMARVRDYLWLAEDGMKMQGYNGSQCWDTSFCVQALSESNMLDEFPTLTTKVWDYLERTQILSTSVSKSSPAYEFETNDKRYQSYRHISEGGWPFSTSAHGWPISDCTGEGLKATLCLLKTKTIQTALEHNTSTDDEDRDKDKNHNDDDDDDDSKVIVGDSFSDDDVAADVPVPVVRAITDERLFKAANILLTYQNEDGGWATYENNRGWGWYEQLNPSEVFGDIMIDYSYVECSMASLTALADFAEKFPEHRPDEIRRSIEKGRSFLKCIQRDDGSWYGSWACCFCYGIWFGIEGLIKCGEPIDSPSIKKACAYLLSHQRPNGGWGEDFTSCYDKDYAVDGMKAYGDSEGSSVVNTSWALMALSYAECDDVAAIRNGVQYLMKRQLSTGDWPQEGISGVFNRSVGITYTAYRNVFPIWAMGRCRETYGEDALSSSVTESTATTTRNADKEKKVEEESTTATTEANEEEKIETETQTGASEKSD